MNIYKMSSKQLKSARKEFIATPFSMNITFISFFPFLLSIMSFLTALIIIITNLCTYSETIALTYVWFWLGAGILCFLASTITYLMYEKFLKDYISSKKDK